MATKPASKRPHAPRSGAGTSRRPSNSRPNDDSRGPSRGEEPRPGRDRANRPGFRRDEGSGRPSSHPKRGDAGPAKPFSSRDASSRPLRKGPPKNVYRRAAEGAAPEPGPALCGLNSQCGSCAYVNRPYAEALLEKYNAGLDVLKQAGVAPHARFLPPEKAPRPLGYRSLFKLAVRPAKQVTAETILEPSSQDAPLQESNETEPPPIAKRFAIGLFAEGTHDVIELDDCPLHTPPLRRLIRDIRNELDASPLTPYDEVSHSGDIRYLAARAAHLTGELMVTFVVTRPLERELKTTLKGIIQRLVRRGHKINSAHANLNTEPGNAIFGSESVRIAGADRLRERLCDLDFEIGPTSFFQINPWQAINLYRRVEQIAGTAAPGAVAWDLYCGIGQISMVLARLGYRVLGIEENPQATADAAANARKNYVTDRTSFLATRVEDAEPLIPLWARDPELIVCNPSRRGLAPDTRKHLRQLLETKPAARLLYVSCEVTSLARDLKELIASGFQVRQVEAFDMFAQTDNMEWLVVLTR